MSQTSVDYPAELTDLELKLTSTATEKMAELMSQADPGLLGIRVFVGGGGCGGMQYGLTFVEDANDY
ncbi:MAG: hypothetical protein OEY67_03400, partial [Gammaproteobacteria bacterium]|nr:hypothetical protein [Gammaproteobacteria bacterium]